MVQVKMLYVALLSIELKKKSCQIVECCLAYQRFSYAALVLLGG